MTDWFGSICEWWEVVEDGVRRDWGTGNSPSPPDFEIEFPFDAYLAMREGRLPVRHLSAAPGVTFSGDVDALLFAAGLSSLRQEAQQRRPPDWRVIRSSDALNELGPSAWAELPYSTLTISDEHRRQGTALLAAAETADPAHPTCPQASSSIGSP
jgi:hypothetical protein